MYGCGPSPEEQAQAQFTGVVQEYRESSAPKEERLYFLLQGIDKILENYKTVGVSQDLLRGESIILGKSLNELKQELIAEQNALDYSRFFLALVEEQCLKYVSDPEGLKSKLKKDELFRPVPNVDGSFEIHYKSVSFGVTLEDDRCTVDVMLKNAYHDILFQNHHIDELLKPLSEDQEASFREGSDTGPEDNEVKVLNKEYKMADGNTLQLAYPVTGLSEFYMYVSVIPPTSPKKKIQSTQ